MFAAVDVHHVGASGARAALVAAADVRFSSLTSERTVLFTGVELYRPGEFYRRELEPVLAVCAGAGPLAAVVTDGYVDLDPCGRRGLGSYVREGTRDTRRGRRKERLSRHLPRDDRDARSVTPSLYVTAAGMEVSVAAAMVRDMAGTYRIPDALRKVDRLGRGIDTPETG
jgi:deoxyribonuclease V